MSINAIQEYQASIDSATKSASSGDGLQETFLTLLIAQLENQDPTDPVDSTDLTTQLAQISTVEGLSNLNTSIESLLSSYQSSQTLQAAALIDHTVLVEGNLLTLGEEGAAGRIELGAAADSIKVTISDADGHVVQVLDLGANPAGAIDFYWDGADSGGTTLETGQYSYSVSASSGGNKVSATPYALGLVTSVAIADGALGIHVSGIGSFDLSEIKQIF
jgi:flagellar basal-body rod modification protein FlgD